MNFPSIAKTATLALAIFAATPVTAEQAPKPLAPQPDAAALKPGLAVKYYATFVRHIDELKAYMSGKKGKSGEPIPSLDYNVGEDPMLTSELHQGLGAHITGLIHLKEPGTYTFVAMTNDGYELNIGNTFILADPDVHPDQQSDIAKVEIIQPGWYSTEMFYFQRKGTSTLELYWRPPWEGPDAGFSIVPPEFFAHMPGGT
ncbi:MAG: PA14 domain-containing protein [Gammaproteobacteria bacterium]|nr:PA14 domain-containing protein [Gammaproteobacteria bacterium]